MLEALCILCGALWLGLQADRVVRVNREPHVGDSFTYLRVADAMAAQRSMFPELDFYYSATVERLTLPPLMMMLLVPLRRWPYRFVIQIPALLDLATAALVMAGGVLVLGLPTERAVLAGLVTLLAPINLWTQPTLTPRPLALLWLVGLILGVIMAVDGAWYGLPVAIGCAALVLLSQRMATQILVILAVPIAVAAWLTGRAGYGQLPLAVLAGGLLAFALTRGGYRRVLHDHWIRLSLHFRLGHQDRMRREFGNPLQILKSNPWVVLAFASLLAAERLPASAWLPLAVTIGLMLLAQLWFLGNGVNHVYFSAPFVAWLLAMSLPEKPAWVALAACVAVACAVIAFREYRVIGRRRLSPAWLEAFAFVRERGLQGRALVVPQVSFPPLVYYTPLVLVASGHGSRAITYDRLTVKALLARPLELLDFLRANDVRYVLLDRGLDAAGLADFLAQPMVGMQLLYDRQGVAVLARP